MNLGMDLRVLPADGSPGSGIPQATRELWEALVSRTETSGIRIIGAAERGAAVPFSDRVQWVEPSGRALRRLAARERLDGWIVPSGAVSPWISGRIYPWVHDIAIFEHPEWFPQSFFKRLITTSLFVHGLRRATHLFSVSETTKRALMERFAFQDDQITVTGQGVSLTPHPSSLWPSMIPSEIRYLLILGTIEPRKNIPFLLDVWNQLVKELDPDVYLVIAGGEGWGDERALTHERVLVISAFTNAERDALMRSALMVLVPSLYEGFGRVALEAMSCGAPLIASDRGALPEVVGGGGIILPLVKERWIQEIRRILTDPAYAAAWSQKGTDEAGRWTWPNTANTLLARIMADC